MLELRPSCEHCHVDLPPESVDALICSFECTFCRPCAENILGSLCPNCGGELVSRPRRPPEKSSRDPAPVTGSGLPPRISGASRTAGPTSGAFDLRPATIDDVPLLRAFIRELADYENLSDEVIVHDDALRAHLFGPRPAAEALLCFTGGEAAGFAVFFQSFSTFLGRPGLYLEDLFVRPTYRRRGLGKAMFEHLAREANRRQCGRFEWTVLDWNESAIQFYEGLGATVLPNWRVCRITGGALRRFGSSRQVAGSRAREDS